jgi:hypothetical protein
MDLLTLPLHLELFGFKRHSQLDPLITNDVLYQLSYTGPGGSPGENRGVEDARNIVGGPGFGKADSGG